MRPILAASLVGVAAAFAGCQCCVDGAAPHVVSNEPLGARCAGRQVTPSFGTGEECAAGLACIGGMCTVSCATSPADCPAPSICVEGARDSDGTPLWICLPSCQTQGDCVLGATVAECVSGHCSVQPCRTDADCDLGARCVGASEARGITWNEYCSDGYCQL